MESPSDDTDVPSHPDVHSEGDGSGAPSDEIEEEEEEEEVEVDDNNDNAGEGRGTDTGVGGAGTGRVADDADDDEEDEEEDDDDDGDGTGAAGGAADDDDDDDDGNDGATGAESNAHPHNHHSSSHNQHHPHHRTIKACPNLDKLFGLREIGKEALCWQLSSAKPGNGVEQIRDESIDTYWQSDGNSQPHWIQVHLSRRVAISHVCLYLDYNLDESYTPKKLQVQVGMTNQDLISALHPANTQIELNEPVGWCIIPLSSLPDPLDDMDMDDDEDDVVDHDDDDDRMNDDDDDDDDDEEEEDGTHHARHRRRRRRRHASCRSAGGSAPAPYVRAHLLRISILSMHQNGRDTHVRQVQLYGPRMPTNPLTTTKRGENVDRTMMMMMSDETPETTYHDDFASLSLGQYSTIR